MNENECYEPPFTITNAIVGLVADIAELVGFIAAVSGAEMNPRLRRENRIKTIQASLAIENNSLSLDQVTAIIGGKRVLGAPGEIREVKNAYEAYEQLHGFDPYRVEDMLSAHRLLMADLVKEAGCFRSGGVGVFASERLVHMAPPASRVSELITQLMEWTSAAQLHPLIKSCVFHYAFELIHPFADGNGRMGRMWQTLLLHRWKPLFAWLPVEALIRENQEAYYQALAASDSVADAAPFIEFMLRVILEALHQVARTAQVAAQVANQVAKLLSALGTDTLSGKELMKRMGLSHRQSFRKSYLLPALAQNQIEMTVPGKPNSSKQKYRMANP